MINSERVPFRSDPKVKRKNVHSLEREDLNGDRLVTITIITAHQPVWPFFRLLELRNHFHFESKCRYPPNPLFFSLCSFIGYFGLHHKSRICLFHERKTREKRKRISKTKVQDQFSIFLPFMVSCRGQGKGKGLEGEKK